MNLPVLCRDAIALVAALYIPVPVSQSLAGWTLQETAIFFRLARSFEEDQAIGVLAGTGGKICLPYDQLRIPVGLE